MRRFALGLLLLVPIALHPAQQAQEKGFGARTAPIILDVYSDFQCPSCKALYEGTLRSVMSDYVSKGKVYLLHRDFPLAMHAHAREAACYADAAARVDFNKYEPVCSELFRRQEYWAANGKVDEVVAAVMSPEEMKRVRVLVKDPALNAQLDQEIAMGFKAGVKQTPTMIVTHRLRTYPIAGNVTYPILRRFLDDLLAK
jgi:protein-disulfide isomerase